MRPLSPPDPDKGESVQLDLDVPASAREVQPYGANPRRKRRPVPTYQQIAAEFAFGPAVVRLSPRSACVTALT
jgi:hypothetical protein